MGRIARLAPLLLVAACGEEVLLHRIDEPQANQVLVALGDAGLRARKERDGTEEGTFSVSVRPSDGAAARGVLSSRDLPRTRSPGFSELFGSPGLVPSPLEEHVRYLHALSGELARTLEALDGVLAARVHLALPVPDPLRPDARRTPRASVLLKCRSDARDRLESQADGLRRMVAGAADGLDPASVAVLVTDAAPPVPPRAAEPRFSRALVAGSALAVAVVLGAGALSFGRRRTDGS